MLRLDQTTTTLLLSSMAPQGGIETGYFSEKAQQDLLQLLDNVSHCRIKLSKGSRLSAQL